MVSLFALALLPCLALPGVARAEDGVHAPPPVVAAPPAETLDPAALPEGWTLVEPPVGAPLAIPGPGTPPPPLPPRPPPAGWHEVAPPAGVVRPVVRPADERIFAVGGAVGGGATLAFEGLLRLSPSWVADLGIGPQLHVSTFEPVSTRMLLGVTWQPGHRTARHGIVARGGLGFVEDQGAVESVLLAGYAWRLVPRDSALTLELEAAPGVLYRAEGPYGEEWAALAVFARAGAHFWMR